MTGEFTAAGGHPHFCGAPTGSIAGALWRCEECGRRWRLHRFAHGLQWRPVARGAAPNGWGGAGMWVLIAIGAGGLTATGIWIFAGG